ncbi:endonuclease/exonuclease/phosphatase family protein [Gossypium australe]|uniref:Endonuclease/exonuclease/phosphatase family protein n=1 Tax=Gossypium australe TaxID=47621 RepID=A0A5B6VE57_9ROSI|nr:endonuclease/exonuclease/phosphatase family protein [Gossypium australe]
MTTTRIPITICKEIEKVARSFLWGSNNERRKVALVSWSDVCRPVDKGGLGIRQLHDQNVLFLLKLGFNLVTNTDALWDLHRSNCSYVWRSIAKVWDEVKKGLVWIIQDGRIVNFWNDVWIHGLGPLTFHFNGSGNLDETIRFCDVINAEGEWNSTWLSTVLPREVVNRIQSCNPPLGGSGVDHLSWWWMTAGASSISHELIASALAWTKSCGHSAKMSHLVCSSKTEQRWQRPNSGWVKINVDGFVSNNNTKAAIGGAVRDSNGKWLTGFNMVTWMDEIFKIEARAIVEGMILAWLEGYKQVEINCDNAVLIDTICNGFASISNIAEVRLIHEWCKKDWKVKFRHVWRGSNKVADCLAKAAIRKINQIVLFPGPPQYVIQLIEEDS